MDEAPGAVAVLSQVDKTYYLDSVSVPVLRGIDILIRPGDRKSVV